MARALTGGLFNRLYERELGPEPVVGMGATELCYSDRHGGTIVEVQLDKAGKAKRIRFVEDKATRTDSNGMSDAQSYSYEPGEGYGTWYTRRKDGSWIREGDSLKNGQVLGIGYRATYHDFSF